MLAHPLGPVSWTLANADGSLRKMNKAALARELEKSVASAEVIPKPSTTIINGMSLVQKMKGNDKTFAQLAGADMGIQFKNSFWPQYSAAEETSLQRCQQRQSHQVLGGGMETA